VTFDELVEPGALDPALPRSWRPARSTLRNRKRD